MSFQLIKKMLLAFSLKTVRLRFSQSSFTRLFRHFSLLQIMFLPTFTFELSVIQLEDFHLVFDQASVGHAYQRGC